MSKLALGLSEIPGIENLDTGLDKVLYISRRQHGAIADSARGY